MCTVYCISFYTGVLQMQVQRKNESGVESNCLLLILLMILNFFWVLLEIKLLKRGKLLNFEFIKVSWLIMEKCLSDELNNKMTNLKSSISEHAIEQVQKKTRRLCLYLQEHSHNNWCRSERFDTSLFWHPAEFWEILSRQLTFAYGL